jgi:hypothetical protein
MGKWLTKFLTECKEPVPDIPDILPSVSGLSGCSPKNSSQNKGPDDSGTSSVVPPLLPGWLVAYRDRPGVLCGGCDDRDHGTVQACRRDGTGWTVLLTDGQRLALSLVRSVGQTNEEGRLLAAWTVKDHGFDGASKT